MITHATTDLMRLDAIALRVDRRRKRQNYWDAYSLTLTQDGAGLLKAYTDATVPTVAIWFKEAGALVLGVVTESTQEEVTVTFKAARHE